MASASYRDLKKMKAYLEEMGLTVEEGGQEKTYLQICVEGDVMDEIECSIYLTQHDDGDVLACISCFDFEKFDSSAKGYVACNKANDESVVAKFYIDEDGDPVADFHCWYEDDVDEEHFYRQLQSFICDIDDTYVLFEKIRKLNV